MKVAVLFSGGKDSTQAVIWCKEKKHDIVALIAVKPKSTEAYLWHYATVEWTKLQAEAMGLPLVLVNCEKIGPENETKELEGVVSKLEIDAIVLGGVGLQETQIKTVGKLAKKYGIEVLVPYSNLTSEQLLREEIKTGLDIRITDVASDGLGTEWLGKRLNSENLEKWLELSKRFGFDCLGEGGYMNSFVVDAPIFKKRIEFKSVEKVWDNVTSSGFLEVKEARLVPK